MRRDGQILRTSLQKPVSDPREPEIPASWRQATLTAAKVGDEIITLRDLKAALTEHCKRRNIPFDNLPREEKNAFCAGFLKEMINQTLLLQEAKRTIKSPKMYDQFTQEADRFWREDQVPQLEAEFAAENEQQLREKLKEHGRSFDTLSQMTRRSWMSENFLHAKLKDRVKAELPELLKYYNEHLRDKEFDRPAQITWREIVVEAGPQTTREQARRKIEAIHQSLRRGSDFAALAKAHSEGPSRSREQGGLMQTSPGSYGVASVNEALESLPIGQVSAILEGPSSFHILRVEGRRAAGPAPFEDLQDEIRSRILDKKFQAERAAYIQKLWDDTFVTTFLDDTESNSRQVTR
jgi:peptidyl-prolyl cis-trans isomerase SurA